MDLLSDPGVLAWEMEGRSAACPTRKPLVFCPSGSSIHEGSNLPVYIMCSKMQSCFDTAAGPNQTYLETHAAKEHKTICIL
jgi:hypothetical protein